MAKKLKQGSRGKAKKSKSTSAKRGEPKSGKVCFVHGGEYAVIFSTCLLMIKNGD